MTLASKVVELKLFFATTVDFLIEKIATYIFNYPNVSGMSMYPPYDARKIAIADYVSQLPIHQTAAPPRANPTTFLQVIFGNFPEMSRITRTFYEHKSEGFYNFYVPNYQNIFFLPDWLSQWIQINLDISIDTAPLEIIQQSIFVVIIGFFFLIEFRLKLYWFLTINPYTRPWIYLISLTDWINDFMTGLSPVFLGIDLTAPLVLGITGKLADSLNHLVFTMPFLPSEGQAGKMMIDGKLQDVILFRYLPSLWYTHPVPNQLREFWYKERPDIYNFMKKNYDHLDIEFLPNRILKEMYEKQQVSQSVTENITNLKEFSLNIVNDISTNSYYILDHHLVHSVHLFFDNSDKFIT